MKKLALFLILSALPFLAYAATEIFKSITFKISSTDVDVNGLPTMYHLTLDEEKDFSDGTVKHNVFSLNVPPSTVATQGMLPAVKSAYLTQVPVQTVTVLLTPTPNEQ